MRKFVLFRLIAKSARNHNIFGAIRATARKRNDMINLIVRPCISMTIIALATLRLVLSLDVIRRVSLRGRMLASAPPMFVDPQLLPILQPISAIVLADFLPLFAAGFTLLVGDLLLLQRMILLSVGSSPLLVRVVIGFCLRAFSLCVGRIVALAPGAARKPFAFFATTGKAITHRMFAVKEVGRQWFDDTTLGAGLRTLAVGHVIMEMHQKLTFLLPKPRDARNASPGLLLLVFTPVSIAQGEEL